MLEYFVLFLVNHLVVTVFLGYLRYRKYYWHYKETGRLKVAFVRCLYRRVFHPGTVFVSILLTLAEYIVLRMLS